MLKWMHCAGGELKSDALVNRGGPVRTFSVIDPSIKRKRLIVNASLLDLFLINGVLLYVGLFVTPSLLWVYLLMIPIMTVVILFQHVFLKSILMRGAYPVTLYSNGIEFPSFLFNRMIRRPEFLKREDIATVSLSGFSQGTGAEEMKGLLTLCFKTRAGKCNDTGARSRMEVELAIEWMEKNWGVIVERTSAFSSTSPQVTTHVAHKVAVGQKYCTQCGKGSDQGLNFCLFCGAMFEQATAPTADVHANDQWQARTTPQHNPYQRAPSDPYQPQPAGYGPTSYPNGKNPRKAFILGLGLGFLGLMGLGHIYMEKAVKGIALFIVGGFLASLSLFSWLIVLEMSGYSAGVRIVTALIMSAPYLSLQIWQAFDAPKLKKQAPLDLYWPGDHQGKY